MTQTALDRQHDEVKDRNRRRREAQMAEAAALREQRRARGGR